MDPLIEYTKDPRIPCHYGRKCYQKNPNHHQKYKHPPDPKRKNQNRNHNGNVKRQKVDDIDPARIDDSEQSQNKQNQCDNLPSTSEEASKKPEVFSNDVSDSDSESSSEKVDSTTKDKTVQENTITSSHSSVNENATNVDKKAPIVPPCDHKNGHNNEESKSYIKSRFLVEMPDDFYKFFDFCERLNTKEPCEALSSIGLKLVGPFDVLDGRFCGKDVSEDDHLVHWRYYRDPPNFQTVLKGDDRTGYHIGYFRDNPDENPVFLAENYAFKEGILTPLGENIFGAVSSYIEDKKKICDPFSKMKFDKIQNVIKKEAEKLGYDISRKTKGMIKRNNKVLSRTFNKVGLVVPYERKTQLGYRKPAMSDKDLEALLTKIDKAAPEQKPSLLGKLQSEILTWTDIASDECDFGTGIELGWDILCHGLDLNHTASRLLASNYRQLKWEAFAKIAEAHMANRKKGCNLSVI